MCEYLLESFYEGQSNRMGKFKEKCPAASLTSRARQREMQKRRVFLPPIQRHREKKLTVGDTDTADFCSLNRIGGCNAVKGTTAV